MWCCSEDDGEGLWFSKDQAENQIHRERTSELFGLTVVDRARGVSLDCSEFFWSEHAMRQANHWEMSCSDPAKTPSKSN